MSLGREREPIRKTLRSVSSLTDINQERLRLYLKSMNLEYPWESLFVTQFDLVYKPGMELKPLASISDIFLENSQDGLDSMLGEWL